MTAQEKSRQVIEQELRLLRSSRMPRQEEDYCPCDYCHAGREYKLMSAARRRAAYVINFNPNAIY